MTILLRFLVFEVMVNRVSSDEHLATAWKVKPFLDHGLHLRVCEVAPVFWKSQLICFPFWVILLGGFF